MSSKKSISLTYLLCIVLLLVSLFVYLFYRSESTIACKIFTTLFSAEIHYNLTSYFSNNLPLSMVSVYSIPAGLWVLSATLITFGKRTKVFGRNFNLALLPLVYGLGLEAFQAFQITNGTFDVKDVIIISIFWVVGMVYLKQIPAQIKNHSLSSKYIVASYLILFLADTVG